MRIDDYCDDKEQELSKFHPTLIKQNQEVQADFQKHLQKAKLMPDYGLFNRVFIDKDWQRPFFYESQIISPIIQFLSTHYAFKDLCLLEHPDVDATRCAAVYFYTRNHDEYDKVKGQALVYNDFENKGKSIEQHFISRENSEKLLYFGFLLFMLEI